MKYFRSFPQMVHFGRSQNIFVSLVFILLFMMPVFLIASTQREQDSLKMEEWLTNKRKQLFTDTVSINSSIDSVLMLPENRNNYYLRYSGNNLKGTSHWVRQDYDSAIYFYRMAYDYALKGNLIEKSVGALGNIGLAYRGISKFDSSLIYYSKSIELAREYGLVKMQVRNLIHLNYVYANLGDYAEAARRLFEAKKLLAEIYDPALLALVHAALGYLYNALENFEESRNNFLHALHYDSLDKENFISHTIFFNLGEMYWNYKKDIDSSRYFLGKGLEAAPMLEKEAFRVTIEFLKGNYFYDLNQYDSAVFYYQSIASNSFLNKDVELKTVYLVNLGLTKLKLKKWNEARKLLSEAYDFSVTSGLLKRRIDALDGLISLDSADGNLDQAYHKLKELIELEKKLQSETARNKLQEIEINKALEVEKLKFDYLSIETELKSRQIENQLRLNVLFVVLLFGGSLFTFIQIKNYRKIKRLNESLLTKKNELEESNKTKDKFFSILSHDLKSPFSGLMGLLEMLSADWKEIEDDEKLEIVKMLHTNSLSTYQLLDELLSWSKSQRGLINNNPENIFVADLVNDVAGLLKNTIHKKSINLEIDVNPQVQLYTDPRLLSQVIQNFLNNAVKYTPREGTVKIYLNQNEKHICINVEDKGIGIPQSIISKLFDLDCDFGRPGTENEKSTGMGLILSKEFAHIMKAEILVKSAVNEGSTFSICFNSEAR